MGAGCGELLSESIPRPRLRHERNAVRVACSLETEQTHTMPAS